MTEATRTTTTFLDAERRLMEAYDLQYESHRLDLAKPRMGARVIEAGEGDPVVMVHGAFTVAAEWVPLIADLSGYRILAVDLPGYGMTDPFIYRRGHLRENAVDFLDSVIGELGLDSAPIVATSMGGLWTLWLALDRPHRVQSMTLIACPALLLGTSAPLPYRLLSVRGMNRLLLRALPAPDGREDLRHMGEIEAAESAPQEYVEVFEAAADLEAHWPASLSLLEAVARIRGGRFSFGEDDLARIPHPALFVWGDNDPFGPVEVGRRACEAMAEARLVEVTGGHLPWIGRPAEVAAPIREHLVSTGSSAP